MQLFFAIVILLSTTRNGALEQGDKKRRYAQRRPETRMKGPDRPTLYDENDQILQLNNENYREKMYNQDHIVLLEFYFHWCAYCKTFSPTYKALAESVKGWHSVVRIAAMNCIDELNVDVCRKLGRRSVPDLRIIPAQTSSGSGYKIGGSGYKGSLISLKSLIKYIIREVDGASGIHRPTHFPRFKSLPNNYRPTDIDAILGNRTSTEKIIISFQSDLRNSTLAKEIALDLLGVKGVDVYSARATSTLARQYRVLTPNTVVLVQRSGYTTIGHSRADVRRHFKLKAIPDPNPPTMTTTTTTTMTAMTTESPGSGKDNGPSVYEVDLESAIHNSLRNEMGLVDTFRNESFDALKSYVKALAKYFPGREPVRQWLGTLDRKLDRIEGSLNHTEYNDMIEWSSNDSYLPKKQEYLGCKGSEVGKRGYTCSLWTLFHTLTVSAHQHHNSTSRSSPEFKPQEILEVMKKYIKNFFGCSGCAEHFVGMASEPREIFTYKGSVFWLWHAHNRVNFRLKGDVTEDKQFPKIIFPSHKSCPHCRIGKHRGLPIWNMGNVLNFLERHYSRLRFDGVPTIAPWNPVVSVESSQRRFGPYRWFDYEGKGAIY